MRNFYRMHETGRDVLILGSSGLRLESLDYGFIYRWYLAVFEKSSTKFKENWYVTQVPLSVSKTHTSEYTYSILNPSGTDLRMTWEQHMYYCVTVRIWTIYPSTPTPFWGSALWRSTHQLAVRLVILLLSSPRGLPQIAHFGLGWTWHIALGIYIGPLQLMRRCRFLLQVAYYGRSVLS